MEATSVNAEIEPTSLPAPLKQSQAQPSLQSPIVRLVVAPIARIVMVVGVKAQKQQHRHNINESFRVRCASEEEGTPTYADEPSRAEASQIKPLLLLPLLRSCSCYNNNNNNYYYYYYYYYHFCYHYHYHYHYDYYYYYYYYY